MIDTDAETGPLVNGQLTTPTRVVQAVGTSFAYRRFGTAGSAVPLVMLPMFRANLDSWDPALVDRLATHREVILFDNRGVAASTGVVPRDVTEMAGDALGFLDALGVHRIDLLGHSLGGHVAQELTLLRPRLVRRLVLAGTAAQGAPDLHRWSDETYALAAGEQLTDEDTLSLLFAGSADGQARGAGYLRRCQARELDRDRLTDPATRDAQFDAMTAWGIPDASQLNRLAGIAVPTLVANGDADSVMRTQNSYLLANHLRRPDLRIYPAAGHGFLFQYPDVFAGDVHNFLAGP